MKVTMMSTAYLNENKRFICKPSSDPQKHEKNECTAMSAHHGSLHMLIWKYFLTTNIK